MYPSWIFVSRAKQSKAELNIYQAEQSQAGCFFETSWFFYNITKETLLPFKFQFQDADLL